jgi:hypothetical protein
VAIFAASAQINPMMSAFPIAPNIRTFWVAQDIANQIDMT